MNAFAERAREPWANREFLDLLESVPDAMIVVDGGGGIVLANSKAETLFGYSGGELVGQELEMLMPERFRAAHRARRDEYFLAPRRRPLRSGLELYALRKDGVEIPVDIGLSTLSAEEETLVIASIRDSTERRLLERSLRERNLLIAGDLDAEVLRRTEAEGALKRVSAESEARYRSLFEQIPVGVARAAPDGNLLEANPTFAEMFGFPDAESMKGVAIPELYLDPEDRDRMLALVREGDVRDFETRGRRRDGSTLWVAVNLRIVRDPSGRARSLEGVVVDVTARKQAEEELRRSELMLRKAQEIAHVGSWDWDITADAVRESDEIFRIFGIDPRRPRNMREAREAILAAVHAEDRDRVAQAFEESLKGGKRVSIEYRIVRPDGAERSLYATSEVVCDSLGRPSRWIGALQDVTERKRAEEARASLAAIVQSSGDAIYARDLDGIVTSWNQAAERLYGFTAAEMVGRTLSRIMPPDLGHEAEEIIRRVTGGEAIQYYRAERMRKDGARLTVSLTVSPILDDAGRLIGVATISRDVTERKLAEQALAERARLAQFTAEIGAALTQIEDLEGMLRRCAEILVARLDAAFARFWTLNEAENVLELQASAGMYTHVDGPHRRVPVGSAKIGRIAAQRRPHLTNSVVGDPEVSDQEWARREGMIAFAGYPLLVEDRLLGVMAMFARRPLSKSTLQALAAVDKSIALAIENRRTASALRAALRRAEESDRLKTAFLANVTHEIRTPLNVILGFADVVAGSLPPEQESEMRPVLSAMTGASDRLLRTVDGVLDAAMLEAGTYQRRPALVALAQLIEQQLQYFERQMRDKGLTWSAKVEEPAAIVRADEHGLRTVLHHLLSNAVKFTSEGAVAVRLGRDAGGALTIEVQDSGVGIDPAFAARLFRPFSQEDPSSTRRYEGPGLGLALCKRFLDLEGAAIRVSTEKGRGTTFAIRFDPASEPRAAKRAAADDSGRPEAPGAAPRGRQVVLAVEDDPDSRHYVQRILKDRFTVLMAASAEEAFELLDARGQEIDAALLDIALRGPEDGLAVARYIRQSGALQRIPVIAATAHVSPDDRQRCLAAGCDDYLAKPFSPEALLATLDAHGLTAPAVESIHVPAAGARRTAG